MYLSVGAVSGIGVSLFTRRPPQEKLDRFYQLIRTPVRPGEVIISPCTLPEGHLPADEGKLISHPDLEIPSPSRIGIIGFVLAWVMVAIIIGLTKFLAGLG